jgi:3-oxoacyl-[acyl-carrier protein] reductase
MAELAGQVALVTGGSRGIGKSICERLAADGARVAVVARDQARAEEVARTLAGEGHSGYACDVADSAAVDALIKQVEQDLGALDIIVNNAGITADNLLVRIDDAAWQKVMDTNLKGAFNLTRAAARGMMRRRKGRIINITSVVGLTGNAGQANYAASKAGLIGLTKAVAKELASRNVLVNAIAPGFIETEMTAELSEAARTGLLGQIALGKLGKPEDVAGVVRFLSGPDAAYITGQVLVVDGGMVM